MENNKYIEHFGIIPNNNQSTLFGEFEISIPKDLYFSDEFEEFNDTCDYACFQYNDIRYSLFTTSNFFRNTYEVANTLFYSGIICSDDLLKDSSTLKFWVEVTRLFPEIAIDFHSWSLIHNLSEDIIISDGIVKSYNTRYFNLIPVTKMSPKELAQVLIKHKLDGYDKVLEYYENDDLLANKIFCYSNLFTDINTYYADCCPIYGDEKGNTHYGMRTEFCYEGSEYRWDDYYSGLEMLAKNAGYYELPDNSYWS